MKLVKEPHGEREDLVFVANLNASMMLRYGVFMSFPCLDDSCCARPGKDILEAYSSREFAGAMHGDGAWLTSCLVL